MDRIKHSLTKTKGLVGAASPAEVSASTKTPTMVECDHKCYCCAIANVCGGANVPTSKELVYFSKKATQETSRVPSNSIVGRGISFLSCDEKDIFVNPCHLNLLLNRNVTPSLSSLAPICVNFAADGTPRIEGMPWEGLSGEKGSQDPEPTPYDPADPSTYIAFGQVLTNELPAYRMSFPHRLPPYRAINDVIFGVLGFRLRCRIFDTELGASTVGVRVFSGSYEKQVLNALLSVDASEAELTIPYFSENVTQSTSGVSETSRPDDQTLIFGAISEVRDGSYNLTMGRALLEEDASITQIPSFFTLTGQNVYVYVTPILATDKNVSALVETLRRDPAAYLATLQNKCF